MTATILVKEGPVAGQRVELDRELAIGRDTDGLVIDDPELSRRHAVIRLVDGEIEVEDLQSLNGTFVNGRRIEAATRVGGGDTIKIGRTVLEVEAARAAATIASAVPPSPAAPSPLRGRGANVGDVPAEPFGTFAAPAARRGRGRIASRQLLPMLISWAVVAGTAVALAVYFAKH
jgi:predicted component of type VI protein secretion system